jgi:hypothetical protein
MFSKKNHTSVYQKHYHVHKTKKQAMCLTIFMLTFTTQHMNKFDSTTVRLYNAHLRMGSHLFFFIQSWNSVPHHLLFWGKSFYNTLSGLVPTEIFAFQWSLTIFNSSDKIIIISTAHSTQYAILKSLRLL